MAEPDDLLETLSVIQNVMNIGRDIVFAHLVKSEIPETIILNCVVKVSV